MAIRGYIVARGLTARGFGPRGMTGMFVQAMKDAMADATIFWRDKIQPTHFQGNAYSRYGYAKRTVKHEARKWRLYRHRNPLEFSGKSKAAILAANRPPKVIKRGDVFHAELPIVAPTYFFQYNPRNLRVIFKAAELVRLNQYDLNFLAKFVDVRLSYHLNKYRYLRSVRRVA